MDLEILRNVPLFEDLNEIEIEKISEIAIKKKFKKGECLMLEGDIGNSMYIVAKGKVKVFNLSEDGKEKIITIFTEDDFIGEMALIDENRTRSATAEALEDTETYILYKEEFIKMLKENFNIVMKILSILNDRVRVLNKKIEILTFKDVYVRFADVILEMRDKYGIVKGKKILIDISLTHKEMGNMLGVTRETMTRIISKLKKEKVIEILNKKIVILNAEKLEELVN